LSNADRRAVIDFFHRELLPSGHRIWRLDNGVGKRIGMFRGAADDEPTEPRRDRNQAPRRVRVDEDGATFTSHIDGARQRLTPESSIASQEALGADVILVEPPGGHPLRSQPNRFLAWAAGKRSVTVSGADDPALDALLAAHLAMCAGQGRDIAFETAERVSMAEYRAMIAGKTGALFGAACELGALAAGAPADRAEGYARLGCAYGIAFQIDDDALGTWGDSARTGKPSGADLAKRKWIFPVVWALAGPPSEARAAIEAAYARGSALDERAVGRTIEALDRLGARDAGTAAARDALREAEAVAATHGIDRSGRVRAIFARAVRRQA